MAGQDDTFINLPLEQGKANDADASIPVQDLLSRYLSEINKYPLLTKEEEERLTKAYYETRDPTIASRIVTANLRLVVKIALDFQRFWMQNFLDLIQEGNVGLMLAVKKFNPYKGVKFSYYASFWIKAYILKFIMDNWRLVKIGTTQAQRKLFYNLNKEKERLSALGFDPVPKLISKRLNVPEKEVIDMEQRMGAWEVSLDSPIKRDADEAHIDFLKNSGPSIESELAREEIQKQLQKHTKAFRETLNEKEQIIFDQRMLAEEPRTLQEIGKDFVVSRERVRQIETKVKQKLKRFLEQRIPDIKDYSKALDEE